MKRRYYIALSALASMLLAISTFGIFTHPSVAHAGSAGQQIYFTIGLNLSGGASRCVQGTLQEVVIEGKNQTGTQYVNWDQSSTDGVSVITQGW